MVTLALSEPASPSGRTTSDPVMSVTLTASPTEIEAFETLATRSPPERENEKVPEIDCPPKARVALLTTNSVTESVPANFTATPGSVLPGISIVVSHALAVVLTRTLVVPVIVTPGTPIRLTVPDATSA